MYIYIKLKLNTIDSHFYILLLKKIGRASCRERV